MPLGKPMTVGQSPTMAKPAAAPAVPPAVAPAQKAEPAPRAKSASTPLTKESYWDRKEERDIQRDKDMAWSGFAQAAMQSVGIIQFNTEGTLDGLVNLAAQVADKLVERRNKSTR